MDLEKCVMEYCRKRDILLSSPHKPLTCSTAFDKVRTYYTVYTRQTHRQSKLAQNSDDYTDRFAVME